VSHRRKQIRDAIMDRLAGVPVTLTRSRVHNWQVDELPGIAVYALSEQSETTPIDSRDMTRTVTVAVELYVRGGDSIDDAVDDLCVAIEAAMEGDDEGLFGDLAVDSALVRTTIGLVGEGDRRNGICRLEYEVAYWVPPGAPNYN
jgi:hypothetical protein